MNKILAGAAVALAVALACPHPGSAELLAHRAAYSMHLATSRTAGGVLAARGVMYYAFTDTCDGWATQMNYSLELSPVDGPDQELTASQVDWESKDGLRYRFRTQNGKDGQITDDIQGEAQLPGTGQAGTATFAQPKTKELRQVLPPGTIFPTEHTIELLRSAEAGRPMILRLMFDGSSTDGVTKVNAIIGRKEGAAAAPPPGAEASLRGPAWWFRLAFFPLTAKDPQPTYEMAVHYHRNGVADELKLDYGDFVIGAKLEKLEVVKSPAC